MKIRLLSNESNSDYIIFNCVEFTTEDLICKYANDQYNFSVKKVNPLELPIATKEKLGAVIVGDGLEVDTAGKITANGGVKLPISANDVIDNFESVDETQHVINKDLKDRIPIASGSISNEELEKLLI